MNHVGHVLNDFFNRNQPSMETMMQNYNYLEKHVPYQWQYKHNISFFHQVMCELKITELKRANTLSTNPSIGEGPSLYDCQMMRSRMKSRILRAFRVTLQLKNNIHGLQVRASMHNCEIVHTLGRSIIYKIADLKIPRKFSIYTHSARPDSAHLLMVW